jgi:tetratricopeptide (TPR) repeat protein
MVLPAVLLLLDFWPLQRTATIRWPRLLLEKVPFALLAAAMALVTRNAILTTHGGNSDVIPWSYGLANTLLSCAFYLRDTFYFGGLSVFYPLRYISAEDVIFSALLLLSLSALAVVAAVKFPRYGRPALVGWLWFLITLAPQSGLIQSGYQSRADRFTYLPAIGLFMALVYLWPARLFSPGARAFYRNLILATLLFLCTAYTCLQLSLWRKPLALYLAGVDRTTNNWFLLTCVGNAYTDQGDFEKAEQAYQASLELMPPFFQTHYNYAVLLEMQHRDAEALEHFRRAHELAPFNPQIENAYNHALRTRQP